MKKYKLPVALLILIFFYPLLTFSITLNIRSYDHPTYTRLVVESDRPFAYSFQESKQSLQVAIDGKAITL